MNSIEKNVKALELHKILHMLAAETSCEDAAQLALTLTPTTGLTQTERLLSETADAFMLMARFGAPGFGGLHNVSSPLRRAQAGAALNMGEFLRIAQVLHVMRTVQEWRKHSEGVKSVIDERFEALAPNRYLEDKINASILSEEEMADTASPELASIRRRIRAASSRVREQLDKMIRSPVYQKYLQDPIVTLRGGRFVVPVRAEFRTEVPGLVHDTSSSGATVFVEPMGVVEANNEIRVLASNEQAEMERILYELSAEAGGFADSIITGYEAAVQLDLLFAKAHLAYKMKACVPKMNNEGCILLKQARHPLIDKNKVVPTDIELGIRFDTLVVTGPNTGGKTVALKTVGLLTLMAMCGLMIPAADGSRLSVFESVLADIGDEQSIEQSLSTFSAHMTNIIDIMQKASPESLVLLDELGAGTDPIEGAALAISILESLRASGAKIAATTHYAELKVFALQTNGVENGSCEFDVATLRPTYRLLIGVPGRSNAFEISLRLGLPSDVVEQARTLVSSESAKFEDVVQSLEASRQSLEKEREEASLLRQQAESLRAEAEEKIRKASEASEQQLETARSQAAYLIARAKGQIDALVDELEERKKQKQNLTAEDKAKLRAELRSIEDAADPIRRKEGGEYVLPRALAVGDTVLIFDIDKQATVLEPPDGTGNVLVQAGIIKTRVPVSNLRLTGGKPKGAPKRSVTRNVRSRAEAPVVRELDLRGQSALEAIMELDNFIDAALLAGVNQLTVIHGKGTGVLRKAVQDHLRNHPSVRTYRLGVYGEGESGVTVVELK